MKIKGLSEALKSVDVAAKSKEAEAKNLSDAAKILGGRDRVNMALASAINQQLDPKALNEEQDAKVARIKALVNAGKYHVKSEDIASAFAERVDEEVFFGKLENTIIDN